MTIRQLFIGIAIAGTAIFVFLWLHVMLAQGFHPNIQTLNSIIWTGAISLLAMLASGVAGFFKHN